MRNKFFLMAFITCQQLLIINNMMIMLISGAPPLSVRLVRDWRTEQEDMATALALSKRFFWRNMMAKWECQYLKVEPKQIGFKFAAQLKTICAEWKAKAMAADAYVKSWECNRQKQEQQQQQRERGGGRDNGDGTAAASTSASASTAAFVVVQQDDHHQIRADDDAEFTQFDCLCVKPRFQVEQHELQLSSAMEMIKAAYRVLFGWSEAAPLDTFIFENKKAWDVVDRWLNAYKFSSKREEKERVEGMLLIAKQSVDQDAYFDLHKILTEKKFFDAPVRVGTIQELIQGSMAASFEVAYEEKMPDGTIRNYLKELKNLMKHFKKTCKKLLKRVKRVETDLTLVTDLRMAHENYATIWELIQELGFDLSAICDATMEFERNAVANGCFLKGNFLSAKHFFNKIDAHFHQMPKHLFTERALGPLLWLYEYAILGPMMDTYQDELDDLVMWNPCEEAKLKLKN